MISFERFPFAFSLLFNHIGDITDMVFDAMPILKYPSQLARTSLD
jgi:hypothetical protein